jgi:hypothetical protein
MQIGTDILTAAPMREHASLYLAFVNLPKRPEACLEFARRWGFLYQGQLEPGASESLAGQWFPAIDFMRGLIDGLAADSMKILPREYTVPGEIRLEPGGSCGAVVTVLPGNLYSALTLQLFQSLSGGAQMLTCEHCGGWFEAGIGHRRTVAKFCSATCRDRFHNTRRRARGGAEKVFHDVVGSGAHNAGLVDER